MMMMMIVPTVAQTPYTPDYTCAVLDKLECVAKPECGWCEVYYTCMRADENGPLPGSLPCGDPNYFQPWHPRHEDACWGMGCPGVGSWAGNFSWTAADLTKNKFGPLKPKALYGQNYAPPEWAPPACINGGIRHWEPVRPLHVPPRRAPIGHRAQ